MAARHDDPWVGVHILTEFIFCPRAGLLAYEQQGEVEEEELPPPQLSYRPGALYWSTRQIKRQLARQLTQMYLWLIATAALLLAAWILSGNEWLRFGLPIGALASAWTALRRLARVGKLWLLQRRAVAAAPHLPDADSTANQDVNWWQLLNAGFDSIPYKEVLRDQRWRCAGKPWRVLRHGSLRIPVFRLKGETKRLYRQHYARMAAYCHLLETCEGAESPYGVILMPNSYHGVTVPNSPASGKAFHEGLRAARRFVREASNQSPPPPGNPRVCLSCKLGRPRVYRGADTQTSCGGILLPPNCFVGIDSRYYHSPCGDRFVWRPPHARRFEKGG